MPFFLGRKTVNDEDVFLFITPFIGMCRTACLHFDGTQFRKIRKEDPRRKKLFSQLVLVMGRDGDMVSVGEIVNLMMIETLCDNHNVIYLWTPVKR